ncbi:MAG: YhcH/YjgK/YiaL family protein [Spirochaetales bacterium]|nr:YhcH/YjgK/YiaL family protein [Spirochaetales bacterium]
MIYSSINHDFAAAFYPQVLKDALEFLKSTDFSQYENGKYYPVEGSDQFINVKHMTTKQVEDAKPETHAKYLDIQFLFKGKERMGIVMADGSHSVMEDKLEEKDVIFYKDLKGETFINMNEGDYCIFFPTDLHRPGCERDGQSEITKVLYKINVDLLK